MSEAPRRRRVAVSALFCDQGEHFTEGVVSFLNDEVECAAALVHERLASDAAVYAAEIRAEVETLDGLVLIIGSDDDAFNPSMTDNASTPLYLAAIEADIPIWAFVANDVMGGAGSAEVGEHRACDFARQIADEGKAEVWSYESLTGILSTLEAELKLEPMVIVDDPSAPSQPLVPLVDDTSISQLVLRKGEGWEGLLFARLIQDEVRAADKLRRQFWDRRPDAQGQTIEWSETLNWVTGAINDAQEFIQELKEVMRSLTETAATAPDSSIIMECALKYDATYRRALRWSIDIFSARIADDWTETVFEASKFLDDVVREMEGFGRRLELDIQRVLREGGDELGITIVAEADLTPFSEALNRLTAKWKESGVSAQPE